MLITFNIEGDDFQVDLSDPIDLSIPIKAGSDRSSAWFVNEVKIDPVRTDTFTGSVEEGGSVNFRNISFNPHGNGTHTECLGHITPTVHSVNQAVKTYFSIAQVISITPEKGFNDLNFSSDDDLIISLEQIKSALNGPFPQSLIIRTCPIQKTNAAKNGAILIGLN